MTDDTRNSRRHAEGTPRMPIPGERERNTMTYRQSGSMGGPASGSDGIPEGASSMEAATITERQKEGGGGASQRPHGRPPFPKEKR